MLPVFLSYKREDLDEVREIAQVMITGGIRLWQDIDDLGAGLTEPEIRKVIAGECSAMLFYATPRSITSEFIRDIELREAFNRHLRAPDFVIVPLFNVPVEEADAALNGALRGSLSRFNGVKTGGGTNLKEAARQAREILLKKQIEAVTGPEILVAVSTYQNTLANQGMLLDFDWVKLNATGNLFCQDTWTDAIRPALNDLKNVLLSSGKNSIKVFSKAQLTIGFSFGFIFKRVTGFTLAIQQDNQWWSSLDLVSEAPRLDITAPPNSLKSKALAVFISVSRDVETHAGFLIQEQHMDFRAVLHCRVPEPSNTAVQNGSEALSIAKRIAAEIRKANSAYDITDVHIVAAVPLALAYLLGSELNACGRLHLYEFNKSTNRYQPSWIVDGAD